MPRGLKALNDDTLTIKAWQILYVTVLNCQQAIRNHLPEVMYQLRSQAMALTVEDNLQA